MSSYPLKGLDPLCPPEILGLQRQIETPYVDFSGCSKIGSLLIHHSIAEETEQIFKAIINLGYPIDRIEPLDEYIDPLTGTWCDLRSMQANNCSAFNYRPMIHKAKLSYHALGLAVDINPMMNPFIKGSTVLPTGASYIPGSLGVLTAGHPVVKLFEDHGWTWGGNFTEIKDYHHFQKFHHDLDYWERQLRESHE